MKEYDQTTINPLSNFTKLMSIKTSKNAFTNKDPISKANTNPHQLMKTVTRPRLTSNRDLRKLVGKYTTKPTLTIMKNINLNENNNNEDEKFNLDQLGRIEYAKQHSSANRPLNKLKEIKEFKDNTKIVFCKCCGLPCITPGIIEPFKLCDNTDKYSILGQAISLYFSFYKFSIFILFVLLVALIIPSFYISYLYYSSLSNMCNNVLTKNGINSFAICENFITDAEYLKNNNKESKESFQSQFNAANIMSYIELYGNLVVNSNNESNFQQKKDEKKKKMRQIVLNNSIIYFVVLITLFIINLLYIIFQNNKILDYNFQIISPSDYTIIMTNLDYAYKEFRRLKFAYMKSTRISAQKEFRRKLGFSDKELADKDITDAMEFCFYIKNEIINKNAKYNIQSVNLCYKLNKFDKLEKEIQEYKMELFRVDYDTRQIKRNRHFRLQGNKRKYFDTPINILNLNTNCCEKRIPIMEILRKKKYRENELNELLRASENIKRENFANVAFISFDTISEQEKFLNNYSKNFFGRIFSLIANFRYYFCCCFLSKESKKKWERGKKESAALAPEPDDIIFKNLETTKFGRITRTFITALISFVIIVISFIIVVLLTLGQEKIDNMSFGAKNLSKYAVSLGMTGVISAVNIIFQKILEGLTELEKHTSLTDYSLSFSIKLTVFTFVNSAIVPLISNVIMDINKLEINYELLVSNMLMMFLVNSFVSPLMWTFNIDFYLKKWQILGIESKKHANTQHKKTQKELNDLYEYVDIELAYKYSYISKTLLMTFFYLPLFPLGIIFSMCGLILGFYLEKFNLGHRYKRPEMMKETICTFYANFFEVNFFMLALGNLIFLKEKNVIDYWAYANLAIFFIMLIVPYGQYLNFNFIGVNQSQIINKKYSDAYFTFYNYYEFMNPFTRKIGTIDYLKRLKEKDYITEEEFQKQKKNIEKLSYMQILSQAKPSRANRAKRSLGRKQALLNNVGLDESDKKARRLFELIKKLYQRPEESSESFDPDHNLRNSEFVGPNGNIPNIIHLVGTIFGTEDEKDNTMTKLFLQETDNEISEINILKDKKEKRNFIFFGKPLIKEKIKKSSPFVISAGKNNKNNKDTFDENNNNLLNINNKIDFDKKDNKININTNANLLSKEDDFSSNRILSEIKSEISKGGRNLMRFTNSTVDYKEKENKNKEKDKENINYDNLIKINNINNNDLTNDNNDINNIINNDDINNEFNNENNEINNENNEINNENNEIKNDNNDNDNDTNTNKNKNKIPLISNISVTINQFFDRFKNGQKDEATDSERIKIDNDNSNTILKKGENKDENKYIINQKKIIPLTREQQKKMNNKGPINNIIKIVVKNDNINKNENEEEDGIYFDKIVNSNIEEIENK